MSHSPVGQQKIHGRPSLVAYDSDDVCYSDGSTEAVVSSRRTLKDNKLKNRGNQGKKNDPQEEALRAMNESFFMGESCRARQRELTDAEIERNVMACIEARRSFQRSMKAANGNHEQFDADDDEGYQSRRTSAYTRCTSPFDEDEEDYEPWSRRSSVSLESLEATSDWSDDDDSGSEAGYTTDDTGFVSRATSWATTVDQEQPKAEETITPSTSESQTILSLPRELILVEKERIRKREEKVANKSREQKANNNRVSLSKRSSRLPARPTSSQASHPRGPRRSFEFGSEEFDDWHHPIRERMQAHGSRREEPIEYYSPEDLLRREEPTGFSSGGRDSVRGEEPIHRPQSLTLPPPTFTIPRKPVPERRIFATNPPTFNIPRKPVPYRSSKKELRDADDDDDVIVHWKPAGPKPYYSVNNNNNSNSMDNADPINWPRRRLDASQTNIIRADKRSDEKEELFDLPTRRATSPIGILGQKSNRAETSGRSNCRRALHTEEGTAPDAPAKGLIISDLVLGVGVHKKDDDDDDDDVLTVQHPHPSAVKTPSPPQEEEHIASQAQQQIQSGHHHHRHSQQPQQRTATRRPNSAAYGTVETTHPDQGPRPYYWHTPTGKTLLLLNSTGSRPVLVDSFDDHQPLPIHPCPSPREYHERLTPWTDDREVQEQMLNHQWQFLEATLPDPSPSPSIIGGSGGGGGPPSPSPSPSRDLGLTLGTANHNPSGVKPKRTGGRPWWWSLARRAEDRLESTHFGNFWHLDSETRRLSNWTLAMEDRLRGTRFGGWAGTLWLDVHDGVVAWKRGVHDGYESWVKRGGGENLSEGTGPGFRGRTRVVLDSARRKRDRLLGLGRFGVGGWVV